MKIDLHVHTNCSDGVFSPEEIVSLSITRGVSKIAITDHDCINGVDLAQKFAKNKDIEIISGIEISCSESKLGAPEIHMVGLFIDVNNSDLQELIKRNVDARFVQKKMILEKLSSLGYNISFEELQKEAGINNKNYGRAHLAKILLRKYSDKFLSINDVFDKLLGHNSAAYVEQKKTSIKDAIDVIHSAGGVAILAHPAFCNNYQDVIDYFLMSGGDGIETDYPYINKTNDGESDFLSNNVKEHIKNSKFLNSGGSDFHSNNQKSSIGDYGVSLDEFEELRKLSRKYK